MWPSEFLFGKLKVHDVKYSINRFIMNSNFGWSRPSNHFTSICFCITGLWDKCVLGRNCRTAILEIQYAVLRIHPCCRLTTTRNIWPWWRESWDQFLSGWSEGAGRKRWNVHCETQSVKKQVKPTIKCVLWPFQKTKVFSAGPSGLERALQGRAPREGQVQTASGELTHVQTFRLEIKKNET